MNSLTLIAGSQVFLLMLMSSFPVCHSVALFGILSVSGIDSKQVVEFRVVLFGCHLCDGRGHQFSRVTRFLDNWSFAFPAFALQEQARLMRQRYRAANLPHTPPWGY